jgi:hypothetical protein
MEREKERREREKREKERRERVRRRGKKDQRSVIYSFYFFYSII